MKKNLNTFNVLILLLLVSNIVNAQNYSDTLDIELSKILTNSQLPGFGVGIVNKEGIVYQKGFGYANKEKKIPYTINTVQPIASVSKTLIAISVMKAIEDGYFTLETNINDILPFRVENPYYQNDTIKIKHLVTHISGINDINSNYYKGYYYPEKPKYRKKGYNLEERYLSWKFSKNKEVPLGDILKSCLSKDGKWYNKKHFSKNKAGTVYKYSNIGANLMAYIIEEATGISYASYVNDYIIDPLKMNDTGWKINKVDTNNTAVLYSEKGFPLPYYLTSFYASGGLRTTISDLSKYLIEVIKGYNEQGILLNPQSYKTMLSPQFLLDPQKIIDEKSIGVFWSFRESGVIGHTGGNPGVTTFMFFNPESNIGMILFTNILIEPSKELTKQFISIWNVLGKYNNKSH